MGLVGLGYVPLEFRYVAIFAFFLVTYLVSAWALIEDLKGIEWFTILTLPSAYAAATGLFFFLLPEEWYTQVIIYSMFGFGMYALYLTENIFSVAAVRTIQLVRAAHAIGFLMTILALVLGYNTIFSLRWEWWVNGLLVFAATWPLVYQALWSVKLSDTFELPVVLMTTGFSLLMGEMALVLSLLPVTVWIASLFLATLAYVVVGLLQHALDDRLFVRTVYEYLTVGMVVLAATLLVTPWK
jgi:hypothetical protein